MTSLRIRVIEAAIREFARLATQRRWEKTDDIIRDVDS